MKFDIPPHDDSPCEPWDSIVGCIAAIGAIIFFIFVVFKIFS